MSAAGPSSELFGTGVGSAGDQSNEGAVPARKRRCRRGRERGRSLVTRLEDAHSDERYVVGMRY
jgi:hypothetical protein